MCGCWFINTNIQLEIA